MTILTHRARGKGIWPKDGWRPGPPARRSIRSRVNAGELSRSDARELLIGIRPKASIHMWLNSLDRLNLYPAQKRFMESAFKFTLWPGR